MPSIFYSYDKLNPTVLSLFESDDYAEHFIEDWLKSKKYLNTSFFPVLNKRYVSTKYVLQWIKVAPPSLYRIIKNNREFLELVGLTYVVAPKDLRLDTAYKLDLKAYVNLTSYITLFSPRAVVFLLLCSRSEEGKQFRKYIKDWSPEKAYCGQKLFLYFQQNANEIKS